MTKKFYSQFGVETWVREILKSMGEWRPDYIVGLTRGGLIPSVLISHCLNIPMHTLNVSLRDNDAAPESNLWMAEDAFKIGRAHV